MCWGAAGSLRESRLLEYDTRGYDLFFFCLNAVQAFFPGHSYKTQEEEEEVEEWVGGWDKRWAICSCTPVPLSCSRSRKTSSPER